MQGNKGGPAIALALTSAISEHFPSTEFVFSVPAKGFDLEKVWAQKYGYEVVENIDLKHLIPPLMFFGGRLGRLLRWVKTLKGTDAMIQMSAISYVGPPSANPKLRTLLSGRFMDFYMSKLLNRPMYAWTQSYGPLTTKLIRFLAKCDLKAQPVIFCRGDDCLAEVQKLLPEKPMLSYPDIAVTLEYDSKWAIDYLEKNNFPTSGFVSLSPSAVIYSKSHTDDGRNEHIEMLKKVCEDLISKKIKVVLVPHTYRPGNHNPNVCDYGTSKELLKHIKNKNGVYLIDDDLSATELKSIISLAHVHIGGRYHSVVASLSSGVPTLSLSWHPKYKDVMRVYGLEDFVMVNYNESSWFLLNNLLMNREKFSTRILQAHQVVIKQSRENVAKFSALIKDEQ